MDFISSCTLDCPDGCSTIITIDDNGKPSIKGNPAHPFTEGFACPKSKHSLERIASPYRITTPLEREGNTFHPISWDEALTLIQQKITSLRPAPQKMLHVRGYGFHGVLADSSRYLFNQLGASATRGALCDNAIIEASIMDFGSLNQNDYRELLNAHCIINWGRDVLRSSIHTLKLLRTAKRHGTEIISISPVSKQEGKRIHISDHHIQITPGTDRFLAAAVLLQLVHDNKISKTTLEHAANGQDFVQHIASLNLKTLAARCGVSIDDIKLLAARYQNTARPVSTIIGWGLQRYIYGGENVRYIDALAVLSGQIGHSGAGVYSGISTGKNFNNSWRSSQTPPRKLLVPKLGEEILAAGDIEFLWIDGTNAVNQTPNSWLVEKAVQSVNFVVVVEAFMNDTAKHADIILPCALMHEREEVLGSYFHTYVQYSAKVFEPKGEARSDYDIISELARRLRIPMPTAEAILSSALDTPAITALTEEPLNTLRKQGFLPTKHPAIAFENYTFAHSDGKYCCPPPQLHDEPEISDEFPLSLQSIINKEYIHSQIPEEVQNKPLEVHVHPETLMEKAIADNEHILLVSPIGQLPCVAKADTAVHKAAVVVRRGGWMRFGRNTNCIIEAHVTDIGGNAAYYSQRVRIEKMP
ncbi:MAG: molybdopterin-dependent oxidoreductase [Desulfovibrionales bacterium]|nr:molybdopterin-dependent oxidoreductase [Desulfovibrionales bacterium]